MTCLIVLQPVWLLVGVLLGAWLWHRARTGHSPIPTVRLPERAKRKALIPAADKNFKPIIPPGAPVKL